MLVVQRKITEVEQGISPNNNHLQPKAITTKRLDTEVTYINENQKSQTTKTITKNTILQLETYDYNTDNLPPLTDSKDSETNSKEDQPPNTIRKTTQASNKAKQPKAKRGNCNII